MGVSFRKRRTPLCDAPRGCRSRSPLRWTPKPIEPLLRGRSEIPRCLWPAGRPDQTLACQLQHFVGDRGEQRGTCGSARRQEDARFIPTQIRAAKQRSTGNRRLDALTLSTVDSRFEFVHFAAGVFSSRRNAQDGQVRLRERLRYFTQLDSPEGTMGTDSSRNFLSFIQFFVVRRLS
jgi:hypothetical protein